MGRARKDAMNEKPFSILDWKKPNGEALEIPDNTISKFSLFSRSSNAKTSTAFEKTKSIIVAITKGGKLPRVMSSPDRNTKVKFCTFYLFYFFLFLFFLVFFFRFIFQFFSFF